jgi:formiminoglutamase
VAPWCALVDRPRAPTDLPGRPDDPRLGERVEFWTGDPAALTAGRPVLLGFPQDEGVRRNAGRPGAARAPAEVRRWLYRLTPFDPCAGVAVGANLLDLGDLRIEGELEQTQDALGAVIAAVLGAGAVPIVLGGGHETAYGHFLGYAAAGREVGIVNLDAHLDVRPLNDGRGHSGSPFRQALEHPTRPLGQGRYACLGAQPFSVAREHALYVQGRGGAIGWAPEVSGALERHFFHVCTRLDADGCLVYLSLDADVVRSADVPGVSAPNPLGLGGDEVVRCVRRAGAHPAVSSLDVVEVNPDLDADGRSGRWAATVVWQFLAGLAERPGM